MTRKVRLDVWGGDNSLDHIARYHFDFEDRDAWAWMSEQELAQGNLVNLRNIDPDAGEEALGDFDERKPTGNA